MVLLYWVLPLLTVTQVLVRWGARCEHKYNLDHPSIAESSPIIILRWWERLLVPNLNFSLHPYRHYFPGIPCGDLPKVHAIFEREGLVALPKRDRQLPCHSHHRPSPGEKLRGVSVAR